MNSSSSLSAFAHITLATRDVVKTADFFAKALGFRPIRRPGNIDTKAAWLEIAAGQEIHLLEVEEFEPSPYEREFGRHLALSYPLSGFAELKEKLAAHGAELIAPKRETPFERFFFRDPNGYIFEIVEADRVSETA